MKVVDAKVERVGDFKARLGEGVIWSETMSAVLWVDVSGQKVLRTDPSTGVTEAWSMSEVTPSVIPCADGAMLVGQKQGMVRFDPTTGLIEPFVAIEADDPTTRTNDAACDLEGRLLVGTMRLPEYGLEPVGSLYQLTGDGTTRIVDSNLIVLNGVAFDPACTTLYWSDTFPPRRQIWRAPYDCTTGRLGEKEAFAQLEEYMGRPDGGTVDAEGCYWVAAVWGWQLLRFTPAGKLDLVVRIPVQRPTKLAFGGPDYKTMFVTSFSEGPPEDMARIQPLAAVAQPLAGFLLAVDVGIQGFPSAPFK
jgi:sugar lactone lactonase YvrE